MSNGTKSLIKQFYMLLVLSLNFFTIISQATPVGDLPGYPYMGKMYSGYLNLSNPKKKLHYLFLESQNNPSTDPVLLWLNGGPGCSSLLGWAQEHGPAVFKEMSTEWELNQYSWNKKANVIYLESPAGVGFSYIDSKYDSDWETNDETSAQQNLEAVVDFFRQFPDYKRNDFYISGESYAGIYVPFLASKILEYNKKAAEVNKVMLKGILVGNGVTDWKYDTTPALIDFAFTHGIYSIETRKRYESFCLDDPDDEDCKDAENEVMNSLETINIYDIYRTCWNNSVNKENNNKNKEHLTFLSDNGETNQNRFKSNQNKYSNNYQYTPWALKRTEDQKDIKNKFKKSNNVYAYLSKDDISSDNLTTTPPCTDSVGPDSFFNNPKVKLALNVNTSLSWGMCSDRVGNNYQIDTVKGSYFLYKDLIASGIKILIYSGDTDAAVPFNGTQKWIKNLNLDIISKWRTWRINKNEVAGYIEKYNGLTFVTVKGTGHMVPQWKRAEAFYMLNQFLEGKDL